MKIFEEKIKEWKNEELLTALERKHSEYFRWLAATEILRRYEAKKIDESYLVEVLKTPIQIPSKRKEMKKKIALIILETFNENPELITEAIIDCAEIPKQLKIKVAKKYLKMGENKDLLKKIIEMGLPKKIEDLAIEKFLRIATKDDLVLILPTTNDEKILSRLLKEELEVKEWCSLIMECNEEIAEKIFEKEVRIENLDEEDLDNLRLSDSRKISSWATKKLIELKEKEKNELEEDQSEKKNYVGYSRT